MLLSSARRRVRGAMAMRCRRSIGPTQRGVKSLESVMVPKVAVCDGVCFSGCWRTLDADFDTYRCLRKVLKTETDICMRLKWT